MWAAKGLKGATAKPPGVAGVPTHMGAHCSGNSAAKRIHFNRRGAKELKRAIAKPSGVAGLPTVSGVHPKHLLCGSESLFLRKNILSLAAVKSCFLGVQLALAAIILILFWRYCADCFAPAANAQEMLIGLASLACCSDLFPQAHEVRVFFHRFLSVRKLAKSAGGKTA